MDENVKKDILKRSENAQNELEKRIKIANIKRFLWLGVAGFGFYKVLSNMECLGYFKGYGQITAMLKEGLVESLKEVAK